MKKTKIIIPALAMMAVTAAAGISGSVAWFTANRVATVTAGQFAVVNTTSDLKVELDDGVGTDVTADSGSTHTITTLSNYKLTDASLDHAVTAHNIIAPDVTGELVGSSTALASADGTLTPTAGNMVRDVTNLVFTAFTWEMKFTVSFAGSASFDAGLFLDLNADETYMHEKVHFAKDQTIPGNTYWADKACDPEVAKVAEHVVTANDGEDVYKVAPDDTGKAFRIAFIPTAIGGNGTGTSIAYSKVWADNEVAILEPLVLIAKVTLLPLVQVNYLNSQNHMQLLLQN